MSELDSRIPIIRYIKARNTAHLPDCFPSMMSSDYSCSINTSDFLDGRDHRVVVKVTAPGSPPRDVVRGYPHETVERMRDYYLPVLSEAYMEHCRRMVQSCGVLMDGALTTMHADRHEWAISVDIRCPEEEVTALQEGFIKHLMQCWHEALQKIQHQQVL